MRRRRWKILRLALKIYQCAAKAFLQKEIELNNDIKELVDEVEYWKEKALG